MAGILRGDIMWAELDPTLGREQAGHRPVLILSHDIFNEKSKTVIAVAMTSQPQRAGFPLTAQVKRKVAKKTCWVKMGQIRTLSSVRLGKKIDHLDKSEMDYVIQGLFEIIG